MRLRILRVRSSQSRLLRSLQAAAVPPKVENLLSFFKRRVSWPPQHAPYYGGAFCLCGFARNVRLLVISQISYQHIPGRVVGGTPRYCLVFSWKLPRSQMRIWVQWRMAGDLH